MHEREIESGGHYANHGITFAVECDRFADNRAIAAEATLPKCIAQNGDVVSRFIFAPQKCAAEQRLHTKQREQIGRNRFTDDVLGLVAVGERKAPIRVNHDTVELIVLRAPIAEIWVRNG